MTEIAQMLCAILVAPFLVGLSQLVHARIQSRWGASIFQPYLEIRKLFTKKNVHSTTRSWIGVVIPYTLIATMLTGIWLIPLFTVGAEVWFRGDGITLVYLFFLNTVFLGLAGLDSDNIISTLGAIRRIVIAALSGPTMMVAILALAIRAETSNLGDITTYVNAHPLIVFDPGYLLALSAFILVLFAETGRSPMNNPATRAELTAVYDAIRWEYSGRHLALINLAIALRMFLFLGLMISLFMPWGIAVSVTPITIITGVGAFLSKLFLLTIIIAALEPLFATLQIARVSHLLGGSFLLSLLSIVASFLLKYHGYE